MKMSEFAVGYAAERSSYEMYAEDPTGLYEYVCAHPEKFVSYVKFAVEGLKSKKREVNKKSLSDQFGYVLNGWACGRYSMMSDGKVHLVRNDADRQILARENREAYHAYRSKGYYDDLVAAEPESKSTVEKDEPFCPYPRGGYCDRLICDGPCCVFHPDYKGELPEQLKRKSGPTAVHDF